MCSMGAATAACSPKDIYMDAPKEQGSWLKKVRHSGEYSNVTIMVENQSFPLHMLPLMQESSHLKEMFSLRGVSKDQPPGTDMAIELPNFPGGAGTFSKAMDFCYSIDIKFSATNVASLMAASKYLGMEGLMKKAEEFLERSVYKNWRQCLQLWAAIDQKDPLVFNNARLSEVSKRCERSFLDCVATKIDGFGPQLWCNIRDVREMVSLSSPNLASRVFQTLVEATVGLYYTTGTETSESSSYRILLYQPPTSSSQRPLQLDCTSAAAAKSPIVSERILNDRASWKSACERNGGEAIQWLKTLPLALTLEWQRAMFIRYIGEWMLLGMMDQCGEASQPVVLEGFLLSLHAEAIKLLTKSPTKQFPSELTCVISRLRTFRNLWLVRVVELKWLANTITRSELDHFCYEILQSIAKRVTELHGNSQIQQQQQQQQQQQHQQQSYGSTIHQRKSGSSKESFKENVAKLDKLIKAGNPLFYSEKALGNFEDSLLSQLKKKTLSVEQVLSLLLEFPPTLRASHEGLYRTLEHITKVKPLTAAELHDVNRILDYRMVSDEVVKSAFRHPKLGFSHSLLNRAMELEISKLDRVKLHYDQDDDCLSSREQLVRSRKCHLILEKALRTHMKASILLSERYRSLEEKVDALTRSSQ